MNTNYSKTAFKQQGSYVMCLNELKHLMQCQHLQTRVAFGRISKTMKKDFQQQSGQSAHLCPFLVFI